MYTLLKDRGRNCENVITFGPSREHIAEIDDPVGRVVLGDVGGLPLPEPDLAAGLAVGEPAPLLGLALRAPAPHQRGDPQTLHPPPRPTNSLKTK